MEILFVCEMSWEMSRTFADKQIYWRLSMESENISYINIHFWARASFASWAPRREYLEGIFFWWWKRPLEVFTTALALRSRGLVIGSREKEKEREEEEKNLQIAIRCLWDLFD